MRVFVESVERTFQPGESSSFKMEDKFSKFSNLFFPEDLEHLRGFSKEKTERSYSATSPDTDAFGQSSVNTKSIQGSWVDSRGRTRPIPSPIPRAGDSFVVPMPLTSAMIHWLEGSELDLSLPVFALLTVAQNYDLYKDHILDQKFFGRRNRIEASIARLDEYLASLSDNRSHEQRFLDVKKTNEKFDLMFKVETSEHWTACVTQMRTIREIKEVELQMPELNYVRLDELDALETRILMIIYGNFKYLLGFSNQPVPELFEKNKFDDNMEQLFGSIDHPRTNGHLFSTDDARKIFSLYLARKVWCLNPWRKYQTATESFYARVCTDIGRPRDEKATRIAKRVLELLLNDLSKEEIKLARSFEPSPDSSCLERSKAEGGKRFCAVLGSKPLGSLVKPVSIYTGGKIRTITKDSYKNMKFNFINKLLGSKFKKLKCSVFGGDVSRWWERIGKLRLEKGESFCSGDLESATDLFDGRITDELIDMLSRKFGLSSEEMKSFTTRAKFPGKRVQVRGQLMGSVISFPLLCILSLTAYLYEHEELHKLFQDDSRKAFEFLRGLRRVGINGDDIVFAGTPKRIEGWLAGVYAIGGVVSRGKSLVNDHYFTVNSELWNADGRINVARPSLITAFSGDNRYFITPQYEWKEYKNCDLLSKHAQSIFDIKSKLKICIPTYLGGLGLMKDFDPDSMFAAYKATQIDREFSNVFLASSAYLSEQEERNALLEGYGPKMDCYLTKSMSDAYSRVYVSTKRNFRLKPHEIRFCLESLRDPKSTPDALKPFKHMFEKLVFPIRARYEAECDKEKELIISRLRAEYNSRMDGLKRKKIPIGLMSAYDASFDKEMLGAVHSELEFMGQKTGSGLPWNTC
jgi:hypothetical protein